MNRLDHAQRAITVVLRSPYAWPGGLDTAAQLRAKMELSGSKVPRVLRFPDGRRLATRQRSYAILQNTRAAPDGRSSGKWPESLIKGCTLRGKLETISALLDTGLSDEETDALLDLLTTLWFESGTWV